MELLDSIKGTINVTNRTFQGIKYMKQVI